MTKSAPDVGSHPVQVPDFLEQRREVDELVRRPWAGRDGHCASAERLTPRGQVGSDGLLAGAEGLTSRGRRLSPCSVETKNEKELISKEYMSVAFFHMAWTLIRSTDNPQSFKRMTYSEMIPAWD